MQESKNDKSSYLSSTNHPKYVSWMKCDQSLVAYIKSTLYQEVLVSVSDDCITVETWNTLAKTYYQVSKSRLMFLKKELQKLNKGPTSTIEFMGHIKAVVD